MNEIHFQFFIMFSDCRCHGFSCCFKSYVAFFSVVSRRYIAAFERLSDLQWLESPNNRELPFFLPSFLQQSLQCALDSTRIKLLRIGEPCLARLTVHFIFANSLLDDTVVSVSCLI